MLRKLGHSNVNINQITCLFWFTGSIRSLQPIKNKLFLAQLHTKFVNNFQHHVLRNIVHIREMGYKTKDTFSLRLFTVYTNFSSTLVFVLKGVRGAFSLQFKKARADDVAWCEVVKQRLISIFFSSSLNPMAVIKTDTWNV